MSTVDMLDENVEKTTGKYLTFPIGEEEYGIEISHVMEIIGIQKITELPDMPRYVKGVLNLRGKVIPVIDIRLRFGFKERPYDERTCIIVVQIDEIIVGIIVDSVKEVLDIPMDLISPPTRIRKGEESRFIQGLAKIGKNVKILLDVSKLLYDKNIEIMQEVSA